MHRIGRRYPDFLQRDTGREQLYAAFFTESRIHQDARSAAVAGKWGVANSMLQK
jgi:hypothetical protein